LGLNELVWPNGWRDFCPCPFASVYCKKRDSREDWQVGWSVAEPFSPLLDDVIDLAPIAVLFKDSP